MGIGSTIMVLYSSFSNNLVKTNVIHVLITFYILMNIIIVCVTNIYYYYRYYFSI